MKNPNNSSNQNAKPSYDVWKGSYRIAICLAAAAIGLSCIATDASARGGGFGGGGMGHGAGGFGGGIGGGHMGGMHFGGPGTGGKSPVNRFDSSIGPGAPGVVAMQAAPHYAVPSYYSRPVCGYYPYPPCRRQH